MANRRERELLARMQQVLYECGTLRPGNPANTEAIFAHSPVLTDCCKLIASAVSSLSYGDATGYEFANDYITEAESRLAQHRERGDIGSSAAQRGRPGP